MAGMSFEIDSSQVDVLSAALEEVAYNAGPYVRDAMERTAIDVRDDWRDRASGMRGFAAYPRSIVYEFEGFQGYGATVLRCKIGPDKDRKQGSFGAIIEYGSPTFAPRHYGDGALEAHSAQFEELLDRALRRAEAALTFGGIARSVLAGRTFI